MTDCSLDPYAGTSDKATLGRLLIGNVAFMRNVALFAFLAGCGGSVADVPDPADLAPVAQPAMPPEAAVNAPAASAPDDGPPPACTPVPEPVRGTNSCAVARDHLRVDGVAVAWSDPANAGRAGSKGTLKIRYRNSAANSGIHYPGARVFSSDARVRTGTEDHGDPFVHADFYMISECSTQFSEHEDVRVLEDVPSGTQITLRIEPAVATGDGIESCDDALAKTMFAFVVP